jgi:hypothetical protein
MIRKNAIGQIQKANPILRHLFWVTLRLKVFAFSRSALEWFLF